MDKKKMDKISRKNNKKLTYNDTENVNNKKYIPFQQPQIFNIYSNGYSNYNNKKCNSKKQNNKKRNSNTIKASNNDSKSVEILNFINKMVDNKEIDVNNEKNDKESDYDNVYNKIKQNDIIRIIPVKPPLSTGSNMKNMINSFNIMDIIMNDFKNKNEYEDNSESDSADKFILDHNKEYDLIDEQITNIKDLIKIGNLYDKNTENKYSINLKQLNKLIKPLEELDKIIGMDMIKTNIIKQIVFYLQGFEKNNNMLHTVIQGPPGVGKTMLGYILAKIYYNMGIIRGNKNTTRTESGPAHSKACVAPAIPGASKFTDMKFSINSSSKTKDIENKPDFIFKIVKRSDLIGEYLGHTAIKTQKVIDECKGGVLFIDEAYSLGNSDKKDTYSKECIDTLNQNLSENKNNFLCIIAGYSDELERCFFAYNEGLRRRFTFKYTIDNYTSEELVQIFIKKVNDCEWKLCDKLFKENNKTLLNFIKDNLINFENYGGDMETLLLNCKISHSMRVFGKHPRERKILTYEDIMDGYKSYLSCKNKESDTTSYISMYN